MKNRRRIEPGERVAGSGVGGRTRRRRPIRDEVMHIRIDSELKEAFFALAARRGVFASELLLELIEGAVAKGARLCTHLPRPA